MCKSTAYPGNTAGAAQCAKREGRAGAEEFPVADANARIDGETRAGIKT